MAKLANLKYDADLSYPLLKEYAAFELYLYGMLWIL